MYFFFVSEWHKVALQCLNLKMTLSCQKLSLPKTSPDQNDHHSLLWKLKMICVNVILKLHKCESITAHLLLSFRCFLLRHAGNTITPLQQQMTCSLACLGWTVLSPLSLCFSTLVFTRATSHDSYHRNTSAWHQRSRERSSFSKDSHMYENTDDGTKENLAICLRLSK